jgi:hypothetical protein
VLTIDRGTSVAIDSLTITDGNSTIFDVGGGITINGGSLTLKKARVSGNTAPFGGGIENNSGALIVNNSTITNNTATFDGGGIDTYPAGTITVRGASRISHNAVINGNGGGIANFDFGVVTLSGRSSITHNRASGAVGTASGSGGGLYNGCDVTNGVCTGAVTLRNASSIHNNIASGNGGGISNGGGVHNQPGLTVTLTHGSTIYDNRADGVGGGIFNHDGTLNGAVSEVNVYDNEPDDIS